MEDTATIFLGGSNTVGLPGSIGFRIDYQEWLLGYQEATYSSHAGSGVNSWYHLVEIATIVAANPSHIVIECATNDEMYFGVLNTSHDRINGWKTASEALIVKLRTVLPSARLLFVSLQGSDDFISATSKDCRDVWAELCTKHDIPNYRFDLWLTYILGHPPSLEEYNLYHDGAHFTELGHHEIFRMIEASLDEYYPPNSGTGWTGNLADYQPYYYDDVADWVGDPILRNGIDNDGETGSGWSTSGTARQSSTAGDTISWAGTFTSFAFEFPLTNFSFQFQIDGGGWTSLSQTTGGPAIRQMWATANAAHTVVLKVVSGTVKVNRFMAL